MHDTKICQNCLLKMAYPKLVIITICWIWPNWKKYGIPLFLFEHILPMHYPVNLLYIQCASQKRKISLVSLESIVATATIVHLLKKLSTHYYDYWKMINDANWKKTKKQIVTFWAVYCTFFIRDACGHNERKKLWKTILKWKE